MLDDVILSTLVSEALVMVMVWAVNGGDLCS